MSEPVENKYIYVPEPRPQGYTAVCDAVSVSMGPRPLSDTTQPETTHPEIGTLGEAMIIAMNKETTK